MRSGSTGVRYPTSELHQNNFKAPSAPRMLTVKMIVCEQPQKMYVYDLLLLNISQRNSISVVSVLIILVVVKRASVKTNRDLRDSTFWQYFSFFTCNLKHKICYIGIF